MDALKECLTREEFVLRDIFAGNLVPCEAFTHKKNISTLQKDFVDSDIGREYVQHTDFEKPSVRKYGIPTKDEQENMKQNSSSIGLNGFMRSFMGREKYYSSWKENLDSVLETYE